MNRSLMRGARAKSQSGFSIVTIMLGLVVASIGTATYLQNTIVKNKQRQGTELAQRLLPVSNAVGNYISENMGSLQTNQSIQIGSQTLLSTNTLSPSVQDLISLGYLPQNFSEKNPVNTGAIKTKLLKTPTGCVGNNCNIQGFVYIDKAIVNTKTNNQDALVVGAFRAEVGADTVFSTNALPGSLVSSHGLNFTNPVTGSPAGVVGILVGFGSGDYKKYLTLNDSRDPNFQGSLTVKGNIKTESELEAKKGTFNESLSISKIASGTLNCFRGAITESGDFFSKSANCVERISLKNSDASISLNSDNGTNKVSISSTNSTIDLKKNNGSQSITMNGTTSKIVLSDSSYSTTLDGAQGMITTFGNVPGARGTFSTDGMYKLVNSGNTIGSLESDGDKSRMKANFAHLSSSYKSGDTCNQNLNGDITKSVDKDTLIICKNGFWKSLSDFSEAILGNTCANENELGVSNSKETMICTNGKWVSLNTRLGESVMMASFHVENGSKVEKPACPNGSNGNSIYIIPMSLRTSSEKINLFAKDLGSQWQVIAQDGFFVDSEAVGIAQTYCIF